TFQVLKFIPRAHGDAGHVAVGAVSTEVTWLWRRWRDLTEDRIAVLCGFKTIDTLIRVFRRRLDTTPTEYRNRFRHAAVH
ncbi:AraC family transcriptional regulator, partial [Streptomyces sp. NPDC002586]